MDDENKSRACKGLPEADASDMTIAVIQFVFDNAELINTLKERGSYLRYLNFDKAKVCEDKINALKGTEESYDKFTRPVAAFITFEKTDGQFRALKFKPAHKRRSKEARGRLLESQDIELTQATEPTNIIWENRPFTPKQRRSRACVSISIILGLLVISFAIILFCKLFVMKMQSKYPKVDCENIERQYEHQLLDFAVLEYYNQKNSGGSSSMIGSL